MKKSEVDVRVRRFLISNRPNSYSEAVYSVYTYMCQYIFHVEDFEVFIGPAVYLFGINYFDNRVRVFRKGATFL